MVRGIHIFKEYFAEFTDNYVIIGGTACDIYEEQYAQIPRATKDMDIILIVEALSAAFVTQFWEFIKTGNYSARQKGEDHRDYYRFMNPENTSFPYQIELFSRSLGLVNFPKEALITIIPVTDDLSSLSAILMNNDYYNFTIEHSSIEDGIHLANIESLICLKAKAFLDLSQRRIDGKQVDKRHIDKHKKDIFRLSAMLAADNSYLTPDSLKNDINEFCQFIENDLPDANFFKSVGLRGITGEQLLTQLKKSFIFD